MSVELTLEPSVVAQCGTGAAVLLAYLDSLYIRIDVAADGWFHVTEEFVTGETGLSPEVQQMAIEILVHRKLIEQKRAGDAAKLFLRLNGLGLK